MRFSRVTPSAVSGWEQVSSRCLSCRMQSSTAAVRETETGAQTADVDGDGADPLRAQSSKSPTAPALRCWSENTGLFHVPDCENELVGAGDPCAVAVDVAGGQSRLLSVKRSSSSTPSGQARGRSSACAARAEAGGSLDSFVSLFDRCEGTPHVVIVHFHPAR